MIVLNKKRFKLPFVDPQTYRELIRLGLRYNRLDKAYSAEDLNSANIHSLLELLERILRDKVTFEQVCDVPKAGIIKQTCTICGKSFQCNECRYLELCETKETSSGCVCGRCLEQGQPSP